MDEQPGYELIDIGEGRRLERFGRWSRDRPAPTEGGFARRDPVAWAAADARFEQDDEGAGGWVTITPEVETPWTATVGGLEFEIRLARSGQVGCFPEQASTWTWLAERIGGATIGRPLEVLDLFAHTGGSTLAAARAGARVVHVDAARPAMAWARRNADLNGLSAAPIRWISDDATAFTRREARRGRRYDGIVLDPPSFGHGPGGRPWQLAADLPDLLEACAGVLADDAGFVVLSAHTPGFDPDRLGSLLADALQGFPGGAIETRRLEIASTSGRELGLGTVARWDR
ncbi:MAG: class I SAM-dependent methyltransferase [Chloroflexota bacterium]|nr:class I SAM-dependent methyltransferase [Chloroflexota bacterium]